MAMPTVRRRAGYPFAAGSDAERGSTTVLTI